MTAITLQKRLIKKISEIDNIAILKSLEMLIKEEEKPRKLSEFQKKLITVGIQEIEENKGIPNELVIAELESKYGIV
jgi:Zn-dependent M32 family carboxypeptidase